ncbi:alpha/beta hydrolase [Rhodococcus sp. X156]|uniref:alpha/beta hydrolase n=1 Tax=Rhodococcus sp. X156 TaxID=2499145 RepID=UPI000FDBEF9C|nr:alpha/beta hydrolase [Rhodococcus sp. X156]
MADARTGEVRGSTQSLATRTWPNPDATYVAVLAHGYGEHVGRYEHVADALVAHGAVVAGLDHQGHGLSGGERAVITDFESVVADLDQLVRQTGEDNPGLPTVLVGHSMGGLIAARYAQRYGHSLAALVLSGPVLGSWPTVEHLLGLPEIPDEPLDVTTLSRDPAVGAAYAEDPLVWHGPFKRPTLEALATAITAVNDGPDLGGLPTLWLHGEDDQLVPLAATRSGVEVLRGTRFEALVYRGARHEIFNETNRDEVLNDVTDFVTRALNPGE